MINRNIENEVLMEFEEFGYELIELEESGHGLSVFHEDPDGNNGELKVYSDQAGWRRAELLFLQQQMNMTQEQAEDYINSIGGDFQHQDVGFYRNCGKEMTELEILHEDVCWFLEGFSMEQIEKIYKGQINPQNYA